MDGYLVVLRHCSDDLPIALMAGRDAAYEFAANVGERDGEGLATLLSIDCTTPNSVWVYRYELGRPVSVEKVKDFDF